MRRLVSGLSAVFLVALVAAAGATAGNGLSPVQPASPNAEAIRSTYWVILIVTGVIFVLVETALLVFIIRFRRGKRGRDQEAPQIHGATRLETSFTIVPVLILFGIMAVVFVKLPTIKDVPSARAANELKIKVVGHQFYWEFQYPNGQVAMQHMVVPIDRVVTLDVVSPDVAHSWWVPALGGKIDAIPGRTNHTWFKAEKLGTYEARCAEFCGLEHAHMIGYVDVVRPSKYASFLAAHTGVNKTVAKEIAVGTCSVCHGLAGQGDYGPKIRGSSVLSDPRALEALLRNGKNKMPPVGATWDDTTMRSATRYLKEYYGGS
ncbi:MAG TPA: cytochrome c oxidase subunit II [Gaiellaceae bacterium]|nr:cytochrome c oxidase subunit II [Gaiellaceae bacterium]